MGANVQQDAAENTFHAMLKVPQLSAAMLAAGLKNLLNRLEQREPVGKQKLSKLMEGGRKISGDRITSYQTQDMKQDMAVFNRLCRRYGVGFSAIKLSDTPGYYVSFRTNHADQMREVFTEYMKYQYSKGYKDPTINTDTPKSKQAAQVHRGEYIPDTAMAVYDSPQHKRQQDVIYPDSSIVRKEAVRDRINRAAAQQRNAPPANKKMPEKSQEMLHQHTKELKR